MTESQKKAAVILAVADKVAHGDSAKPSGYWGVAPMEAAHKLDELTANLSPDELSQVLDRVCNGEVK